MVNKHKTERIEQACGIVADVLKTVKRRGAFQAEAVYAEGSGLSVSTRHSHVDTVEHNEDRSLSVTVYVRQGETGALSKGSASTAVLDTASIALTIDKALTIARLTETDPHAGLAEAELMATDFRRLDTWRQQSVCTDALVQRALAAESAALAEGVRVDQSDAQAGESFSVYANSHGFLAHQRSSTASASVVALVQDESGMERDYWWDASRHLDGLDVPADLGRVAAQRASRRLGARKLPSGNYPVLFEAPVAKSLVSHFLQAISGAALYQEASFLKDALEKTIFPRWLTVREDPFVPGGFASRNFDNDGVQTRPRELVSGGILRGFLLSAYAARRLGMAATGNAGGSHNIQVAANAGNLTELLQAMDRGVLVTELMGQGINLVTGDYSRGASGFWIENGRIQHPVHEITVAGNLRDMFQRVQAVGSDTDTRSKIATGSWLLDGMAVSGN